MGLNHAQRFAAEGAKFVMCDILGEKVQDAATTLPDAVAAPCDLSKAGDVARVIDAAMSKYGRIDILVNNAGSAIIPAPARASRTSPSARRRRPAG